MNTCSQTKAPPSPSTIRAAGGGSRRAALAIYVGDHDHSLAVRAPFWKLAQAVFEALPCGEEGWKPVTTMRGERETLRIEKWQAEGPLQRGLMEK